MRTPSLSDRVVAAGISTLALMILLVGSFVFFAVQDRLERELGVVLDVRANLAREIGSLQDPERIALALAANGIPATVTGNDGVVHESDPRLRQQGVGAVTASVILAERERSVSRLVELDGGTVIEVYASRDGIDDTMRVLLGYMIAGSGLVLGLAMLLFHRVAGFALDPLEHVVDVAHHTASGEFGWRLEPDDPTTPLGRMAVAYDEMLDSLESSYLRLQESEEQTRRFVDDAAHQLRTPLAAIRATVEAMLHEADPAVRDQLMANLLRETARSHRLVNALLRMAQLQEGRSGELEPVDLTALCLDEVDRSCSLSASLEFEFDADPMLTGQWWLIDRDVREILANLLDNARRHARHVVAVESARVQAADHDWLEVRVSDDGPGVWVDDVELIFERFTSFDEHGGSGLGLPIARGLARGMGGDLVLRDGVFVLSLPAMPVEARDPEGDDATDDSGDPEGDHAVGDTHSDDGVRRAGDAEPGDGASVGGGTHPVGLGPDDHEAAQRESQRT